MPLTAVRIIAGTALLALALGLVLALTAPPAGGKGPLPEPDEGPDPRGLTVSGTGVALVRAPEVLSEEAIDRAVRAARPAAVRRAVEQARERAGALAGPAGLTLGALAAVRDREGESDQYDPSAGPHCRRARRGAPERCRVPAFAAATVSVTWATAQTAEAVATGRAAVASGTARGDVRPRDRRDSASIRRAILEARMAAAPAALARARSGAEAAARAGGMTPGALFSVAEVRRAYDEGAGSFGAGRFCGTVRQGIYRRDPETGRRRLVRRVSRVRCFFPRELGVTLRVTVLGA